MVRHATFFTYNSKQFEITLTCFYYCFCVNLAILLLLLMPLILLLLWETTLSLDV